MPAQQVGLGQRAVLEIEERPVEAGPTQDLGRDRRGQPGEGAERHLAGEDTASQVGAWLERVGRHGRPMVRQREAAD